MKSREPVGIVRDSNKGGIEWCETLDHFRWLPRGRRWPEEDLMAKKGGKPTMFICGNDEAAKETVSGILDQFGWERAGMGKAEAARAIEPLCMLWCIPGFLRNEWVHAFKMLIRA